MNIQYYLIHGVDKSRKERVLKEFNKVNIDNTKVKWVLHPNKEEIDDDFIKKHVISGISYTCNKPINAQKDMSKGQISCSYKHYLSIKDMVKYQYDY